ncbi:hypothetical protein BRYFOR_06652 [Marvinbryantia formatexigens DSM 14469]|uniref:Uncharacterized protein n=1 Tax=Marvinbryantia formatexigens DSM 14469 TaxID=478749 RepID=C6LCZ5_9FIRM|nr:hypothetical protein BRYFOR_06652 [Marvinbryantia formatexigens DSM 14469]
MLFIIPSPLSALTFSPYLLRFSLLFFIPYLLRFSLFAFRFSFCVFLR